MHTVGFKGYVTVRGVQVVIGYANPQCVRWGMGEEVRRREAHTTTQMTTAPVYNPYLQPVNMVMYMQYPMMPAYAMQPPMAPMAPMNQMAQLQPQMAPMNQVNQVNQVSQMSQMSQVSQVTQLQPQMTQMTQMNQVSQMSQLQPPVSQLNSQQETQPQTQTTPPVAPPPQPTQLSQLSQLSQSQSSAPPKHEKGSSLLSTSKRLSDGRPFPSDYHTASLNFAFDARSGLFFEEASKFYYCSSSDLVGSIECMHRSISTRSPRSISLSPIARSFPSLLLSLAPQQHRLLFPLLPSSPSSSPRPPPSNSRRSPPLPPRPSL